MLLVRLALIVSLLISTGSRSDAHEDINEIILRLSKKIRQSPSAELYHQRAIEYRALREIDHAQSDFRSALERDPKHLPSLRALTRLSLDTADLCSALGYGLGIMELSKKPADHLLMAEVYAKASLSELAIAHLKKSPPESEHTHLLHAHLVQDPIETAQILKKGWQATKSIVLRDSWLDALLHTDDWETAVPIIEKEIASSRFHAPWLMRRARAWRRRGEENAAQKDLEAALAEIQARLSPTQPDLTLIYDRGLARALIGQKKKAAEDLALLEQSGISPLLYQQLKDLL